MDEKASNNIEPTNTGFFNSLSIKLYEGALFIQNCYLQTYKAVIEVFRRPGQLRQLTRKKQISVLLPQAIDD